MDIYATEIAALTLKIASVMVNMDVPYTYSVEGQSHTYDASAYLKLLQDMRRQLIKDQVEQQPLCYKSVIV